MRLDPKDPAYLAELVFIGSNEKVYHALEAGHLAALLAEVFSKNGKLLENDPGVVTTLEDNDDRVADAPAPAACY